MTPDEVVIQLQRQVMERLGSSPDQIDQVVVDICEDGNTVVAIAYLTSGEDTTVLFDRPPNFNKRRAEDLLLALIHHQAVSTVH